MVSVRFCLVVIGCFWTAIANSQMQLQVGEFSIGQTSLWKPVRVNGKTDYSIQKVDGTRVLQASSRAAASGLARTIRIDLWQYPHLNWRWQIANRLPVRDETKAAGDDYPVRIYIVVEANPGRWPRQTLSYVWSRGVGKGNAWANGHTGRSDVMVSVRDAGDNIKTWYSEKRNLLQDVQRYLHPEIRYVDVVGIMTDTDDTHSFVNGFYGDIYFSNE